MIRSFKCSDTEALSTGDRVKQFVNIAKVARRKLRQLEIAGGLNDLKVPPGNCLEALKGKRSGHTEFDSTISGAFASGGRMQARKMWKSSTPIEVNIL